MNYNQSELTAYCGLYCGDCLRFNCKSSDLAEALLDEIKEKSLLQYAEVKKQTNGKFRQFEKLPRLLEALVEIKCELPCRAGGDGCGGACPIIECVKRKGVNGCWECNLMDECERLSFLEPYHGESVLNNLKMIRIHGIPDWTEYRTQCYPWLRD